MQPIIIFHVYIRSDVMSFSYVFLIVYFIFFNSSRTPLTEHAGLCTVLQVVLRQDTPCLEGASCHAIWLSDARWEEGLQQSLRGDRQVWSGTDRQVVSTPGSRLWQGKQKIKWACLWMWSPLTFVFFSERNFVRYSGQRTGTLWGCTPAKSSIRRTGGKCGKLPRMRSWF